MQQLQVPWPSRKRGRSGDVIDEEGSENKRSHNAKNTCIFDAMADDAFGEVALFLTNTNRQLFRFLESRRGGVKRWYAGAKKLQNFLAKNMILVDVYSNFVVRPMDTSHFRWLLLNRCCKCYKTDNRCGQLSKIRKWVVQRDKAKSEYCPICDPFSNFDLMLMLYYLFCYYERFSIELYELEYLFEKVYHDNIGRFVPLGEDGQMKDLGDVYLDLEEAYPEIFHFFSNIDGSEYICCYRKNLEKNPRVSDSSATISRIYREIFLFQRAGRREGGNKERNRVLDEEKEAGFERSEISENFLNHRSHIEA